MSLSVTTSDTNLNQTSGAISASGDVTLRSDDMNLAGTSTTGANINIYTKDTDTAIDVGGTGTTAAVLELSAAELVTLSSSGLLTIGENGFNTASILLGANAVDLSSETFGVTLATEGAIDDTTGSSNALTLNGNIWGQCKNWRPDLFWVPRGFASNSKR